MADSSELYKKFGLATPAPFNSKLSIHIGEENSELRLIIKHHLHKLGFLNVLTCGDGHMALDEMRHKPVHIALEGDDLKNVNGYDILKELSEDTHLVRPAFIIISKPLNKSELMLSLEKGIDEIMIRPFTQADLYPKIKSAYENFTNPRNPELIYEYAKGKLRNNELDDAYKVYSTLASHTENAARPYVGMARVLQLQKKYEEAVVELTKAIQRNENYIHAYAARAEVYTILGSHEKALIDFKNAANLSPLNIIRYEKAATFLIQHNRIDECLELLNIGVSAGLAHPYIIERTGYCYFMKKDYHNALRYLKEAVRLDADNVSYLNSLAICYRDSKDFEKAIFTYNGILKMQPENHLVLFNKALALVLAGKKEDAIKILHRVLKIDPGFVKAQDKLQELIPAKENKAS